MIPGTDQPLLLTSAAPLNQKINMTINNALASVAVKDIDAAVQWHEKVFGRPADLTLMPALAEWNFEGGGWLQVYALPERAGSCSCTLTVANIDTEAARLEKLGVAHRRSNERASQGFHG